MSSVRRIYVEKKPAYAVAAKDLFEEYFVITLVSAQ